ncbi:MAG TPA: MFS transporter [Solirubrobacteraceae bacterium]|nr:MFS transporter [Solirubrobacteraceae bacterium]
MFKLLKSSSSLRRFFAARLQSELGDGAAYVALVLVAYQRLHSGWAIALVLLADFLPGILLSVPFGALADRFSRRRLAVAADLLRAGAFLAIVLVPSFAATVGFALLAGVGTALFHPAVNAALPGMVTDEQRSPATALNGAMSSIGLTVGPAFTALLLLFSTPTLILAVNGGTFLVSALLLSRVPFAVATAATVDLAGAEPASDSEPDAERASLLCSAKEGMRSAARIPGVSALLLVGAISILAGGLMNVAEPLLAIGPLRAGDAGYSVLVTAYGTGMVAASLINARAGSEILSLRRRLLFGILLEGIGMIASAAAPSLRWAIASFALTGASNALLLGPELRLFQELVSERLLGRVFGLRDMLGNVAFVVAFLSAGAVLALIGVRGVFALGGGTLLALAIVGAVAFRPAREDASRTAAPAALSGAASAP